MRYCLLLLFIFIFFPVTNHGASAAVSSTAAISDRSLIRKISIEGFLLQNKEQFVKLFKPYRNQWLSKTDIDGILAKIQKIYKQEGFQELVSITYRLDKHHLIFSVSMTS